MPIDSGAMSRHHARLRVAGGGAILEDLASRNGTFAMGERLKSPARLADGDEFRLGPLSFTFRVSRTPVFAETRDQ